MNGAPAPAAAAAAAAATFVGWALLPPPSVVWMMALTGQRADSWTTASHMQSRMLLTCSHFRTSPWCLRARSMLTHSTVTRERTAAWTRTNQRPILLIH